MSGNPVCEPHCVNFFFFFGFLGFFLGGLRLHLNHHIACGNLFLAIWDTFHWNFFVTFGHNTPNDIS